VRWATTRAPSDSRVCRNERGRATAASSPTSAPRNTLGASAWYEIWLGRLEALREAKRYELEPADTTRAADPLTAVESDEQITLVRQALQQLPPEYKEVLILKHIDGWSYEQIAESTGDTVGTLKVRAHRARRMLRDGLEKLGWEAGHKENKNG